MLLERKLLFVKQKVEFLKLAAEYEILDPQTQQVLAVARDEPSPVFKYLRLLLSKHFLPTTINVYEGTALYPLFTMVKPFSFLSVKLVIKDRIGNMMGMFKSKLFSLGGGFWIHDGLEQKVGEVKGDWKGWNFQFLDNEGRELGTITKKWAGFGKELFTTADNYMIAVGDLPPVSGGRSALPMLLLAAGLAVDMVFKERQK